MESRQQDFQIQDVLAKLPPSDLKTYLTSYQTNGYELGFGRAGIYEGHAHTTFWDIVFAPDGFTGTDAKGGTWKGRFLALPPRTYFGEIRLGDFFFLKFSPVPYAFVLPDKTYERLREGNPIVDPARTLSFEWYPTPEPTAERRIEVLMDGSRLCFRLNDAALFTVE